VFRIDFGRGWLLYAGPVIGESSVISGNVRYADLSFSHTAVGSSVRAGLELDRPVLGYGAPAEALMWKALQSWPDASRGRRQPAELEALLELAGRYPEEYAELLERTAVFRALGG
jgi:hypothetical protein